MTSTEYSNILFGIIMNLSSCCDAFNMPHYYNREIKSPDNWYRIKHFMYSTYSCHIFPLNDYSNIQNRNRITEYSNVQIVEYSFES